MVAGAWYGWSHILLVVRKQRVVLCTQPVSPLPPFQCRTLVYRMVLSAFTSLPIIYGFRNISKNKHIFLSHIFAYSPNVTGKASRCSSSQGYVHWHPLCGMSLYEHPLWGWMLLLFGYKQQCLWAKVCIPHHWLLNDRTNRTLSGEVLQPRRQQITPTCCSHFT